jgi:hypothetical protein
MSTSSPAANSPYRAVTPRHAVLEELIALALHHVAQDFPAACTTLAGELVDGDRLPADAALIAVRIRAGNLLRDRHFALLHLLSAALERALREALAQQARRAPVVEGELALVPYEEMDERVALGAVARPFDAAHADALALLDVRLAQLMERDALPSNPFRPATFVSALQAAWRDFAPPEAADLLLPLVTTERFIDFGRLYGALNGALERKGIGAGTPMRARPPAAVHDGRRHAVSQQLRRLFAPRTDAGDSTQRLQAWLAGLPKTSADGAPSNVIHLPGIRHAAPEGTLSAEDAGAVDLLAAVFDTVFADTALGPDSVDLLRTLQLPVLKAALADKAFFFEDDHPARRLVDLLARMGWERAQRGDARRDDAQFAAMRRSVDHAAEAAFSQAVRELEAALREEEDRAAEAIAEPVAQALKQEKAALARRAAKEAVAQRLDGEVAAVVAAFLDRKWTDVMTVAYTVEDDKPGAVRHATQAMDDLVWSVQPKATPDERKRLVAALPGLLATLNRWLDVLRWQDPERLRFFAELAECHASIVRAPLDLTAQRRVELSVRAATPAPEEDGALAGIERGAWFAFHAADGAVRNVKLAWISPRRTLFIFSNGAREEAFSLAAEEFAGRLRNGSAAALETEGVVVRALAQALAA